MDHGFSRSASDYLLYFSQKSNKICQPIYTLIIILFKVLLIVLGQSGLPAARYVKVREVGLDTNGYDMTSKAMRDVEKTAAITKAVGVDYDYRRYMDINIEEAGAEVALKRKDKEKEQQLRKETEQSTTMANST